MRLTRLIVGGLVGVGVVGIVASLSSDPGEDEDPAKPSEPRPPVPPVPDPVPAPVGDDPVWPLQHPARTLTADFGAARPFGSISPSRHHVGEDLRAPRGTVVVAPEAGAIVRVLPTWYEKGGCVAGMLLLETATLVLGLGEVEDWEEFGIAQGAVVLRGAPVGRVGCTGMLHFEVYQHGVRATSKWPWGAPKPEPVIDPTAYLQSAGGELRNA